MYCKTDRRRRRRRISIWGIMFTSALAAFYSIFATAVFATGMESGMARYDMSGERIGTLGIILTILAAISIIAVIIFCVRTKDD